MKSSYANARNVASTCEELFLLFGLNQAWRAGLSSFAANRLRLLLLNILRERETRFGARSTQGAGAGSAT